MLDKAIGIIEEQQKGKIGAVFGVGEQLKDILIDQPSAAEMVACDLEREGMSIVDCEKEIHALADERHKEQKGESVYISPKEAEEIIRKFYGIPEQQKTETPKDIDLTDFI